MDGAWLNLNPQLGRYNDLLEIPNFETPSVVPLCATLGVVGIVQVSL